MADSAKEGATAQALVARAKSGDDAAFAALVRRYRPRIYALALHLSRSASEADDITQDVFLRAYRALDRFEGRSEFFTWIYRMTVNRSLNAIRDRKRRREVGDEDPRLELAVAADAGNNPARAAELRDLYARLLLALDRLPVEIRTSVVLVALQGMSHAEAAVIQSCAEGTVSWRLHEARRRLRSALDAPALRTSRALPPRRRELSSELLSLLGDWGWPAPVS